MSPDWSAFDGFTRPLRPRSWEGVIAWTITIEAQLGAERSAVARWRASSDQLLDDLDGDPSARDWTSFLALRRDREEDWSDWLAQLIEDSTTGRFAWVLLGALEHRGVDSYIGPVVHREVLYKGYRADLVIEWNDATYTHVEVKVGDPHLSKTLGTADRMSERFRHDRTRRSDIVLLLPSQEDAWAAECKHQPRMRDVVSSLTWDRVAYALRRALPQGVGESIHWRVWAHAFCGAIEQDLLGMRSGRDAGAWAHTLTFQGLKTAAKVLGRNGDY